MGITSTFGSCHRCVTIILHLLSSPGPPGNTNSIQPFQPQPAALARRHDNPSMASLHPGRIPQHRDGQHQDLHHIAFVSVPLSSPPALNRDTGARGGKKGNLREMTINWETNIEVKSFPLLGLPTLSPSRPSVQLYTHISYKCFPLPSSGGRSRRQLCPSPRVGRSSPALPLLHLTLGHHPGAEMQTAEGKGEDSITIFWVGFFFCFLPVLFHLVCFSEMQPQTGSN